MEGQENIVKRYTSENFVLGLADLKERLLKGQDITLLWCFGAGTSNASSTPGLEFELLQRLWVTLKDVPTQSKVNKFIFLSSGGKMYGINPGHVNENSKIIPVGAYGFNKWKCEQFILNNFQVFIANILIFRIANAYTIKTKNKAPKGLIECCISAIEENRNLTLTSSLQSIRQYASHKDYCGAIIRYLQECPDLNNSLIINLAPHFQYSISEVLDVLSGISKGVDILGKKPFVGSGMDSVILHSNDEVIHKINFSWERLEKNIAKYILQTDIMET